MKLIFTFLFGWLKAAFTRDRTIKLLPLAACLWGVTPQALSQSQVWTDTGSQTSGSAANASTYMNTVLTNETAAATRTALGIVDLVGTNGILLSSSNLVSLDTTLYTQTVTSAATNHILDVSRLVTVLTCTNDVNFVHATNMSEGLQGQLVINANGAARQLWFPATWKFLGAAAPTGIADGKFANLAWICLGTDQTNVICGYAVQP